MNKLLNFLSQPELDKVNPRIVNHAFFTGKGSFIVDKNDKLFYILFENLKDEKDLVFRVQLLELITQSTDKKETINSRENLIIKNLDKVFDYNNLKNFHINNGFVEYKNIVLMATNDEVRDILKSLKFTELGELSRWQLWDFFDSETGDVINFIINYDNRNNSHFQTVDTIDTFLVKFSQAFVRSKMTSKIDKESDSSIQNASDKMSSELTFIEDILMLLDGDEKFYSDDSLIINRFLKSSKNINGFINNLGFKENIDSTIWGLRYSLSFLGFDLLMETLKDMKETYDSISIKHLVRFTKLFNETKVQPTIGIFLSE